LRVISRVSLAEPLPLAHVQEIERISGLGGIGYGTDFAGYYREPRLRIPGMAADVLAMPAIFPELEVPPAQLQAMAKTRDGMLIGQELADQLGWKIGDRIPIHTMVWVDKNGSNVWEFEVVGIYRFRGNRLRSNEFWINYAYFDDARVFRKGTVSLIVVRINDVNRAAQIAERIDRRFLNSSDETETQSEREWMRERINSIGNLAYAVNAVIAAVLFTLLFLVGNSMSQSIRERIRELAVLKACGYSNPLIVALVAAESLAVCVTAALVGLLLAATAFPAVFRQFGLAEVPLPSGVIALGLIIAALVALASALPPSWRACRMTVADALADR
jgi:putative ABC transport system permease protein